MQPPAQRDTLSTIVNIVFILVAVVLLGGFVRREFFTPPPGNVAGPPTVRTIEDWQSYGRVGHRVGSPAAEVVLVEFTDFECPACRAFSTGGLRWLRERLGDSIAIVFRHLPLPNHHLAYPAARAAECAGRQDRFAEYHDALFGNQDSLGIKSFSDFAILAGVPDRSAFDACVSESDPVPAIEVDLADARALEVRATPTILINSQMQSGALDSAALSDLLEKAFKEKRGQ